MEQYTHVHHFIHLLKIILLFTDSKNIAIQKIKKTNLTKMRKRMKDEMKLKFNRSVKRRRKDNDRGNFFLN